MGSKFAISILCAQFGAVSLAPLLVGSGCAAEPALRPAAEAPETATQRCARLKSAPHAETPPEKIEGGPAVLTPEGSAAGFTASVSAECVVTLRGRLASCRMSESVPVAQQLAVGWALQAWRFRPASHDGVPVASPLAVSVPLIEPPPGWTAPQDVPGGVLQSAQLRVPPHGSTIPFGEGMTPPRLVSGSPTPAYTQKAREICVEGKVIARCTLTEDGLLIDCDVLQSVPYLDESVLTNLAQRRYTPVLYKGKPQRVYYTFPINFRLK